MSVMLLDDKVFATVLNNIGNFREYPYHMPMRMDAERTIKELREMNIKSYSIRYNEDVDAFDFQPNVRTEKINVYQLLKYLQCIRYQIEIDKPNFDEKIALNYLDEWIEMLKSGIISNIPEYANAKWANV